jgi:hypothetical protein
LLLLVRKSENCCLIIACSAQITVIQSCDILIYMSHGSHLLIMHFVKQVELCLMHITISCMWLIMGSTHWANTAMHWSQTWYMRGGTWL